MWKYSLKKLLIILLSSRHLPEKDEKKKTNPDEVSTPDLFDWVLSKAGKRSREKLKQ